MCWPPDGSNMCVQRHGQSAPQNKAAIDRRVDKAELALVMKKWDLEAEDDEHPVVTLAREQRRLKARLRHLDSIVNVDGYEEEYEDKLGVLRRTPLSEAYSEEQKQLTMLARDVARLGLDADALQLERERPAAEQVETLAAVLTGMLNAQSLALSDEQKSAGLAYVHAELRARFSV